VGREVQLLHEGQTTLIMAFVVSLSPFRQTVVLSSIFPFSSYFIPPFDNVQPKQVTELTSLKQSLKFKTANNKSRFS
jgi:hypothetical protein